MNVEEKIHVDNLFLKVDQPANSYHLYQYLLKHTIDYKEIVVLCIGTDRCTGDSLGPLVGTYLNDRKLSSLNVYGTLDTPVHALNLNDVTEFIKTYHRKPYIIAVDASLSTLEHVNTIEAGLGSLIPGAALNKGLNAVGDLYIKGNVNVAGYLELAVLQNTRLSHVMKLSRVIGKAIHFLDIELSKRKPLKH